MKRKRRVRADVSIPPQDWPTDPLERSYWRWHYLFYGVWSTITRHDLQLSAKLSLAFEKAGLMAYQGDLLGFVPGLLAINPTDDALRKAHEFYNQGAGRPLPSLRGRRRIVDPLCLRPKFLTVLMEYYRALYEEKHKPRPDTRRGAETAHERAKQVAATRLGYLPARCGTFGKHLEQAQKRYPDLVRDWGRKGVAWVKVES